MRVIGLTGGIGSGKTTVAGFFKELGVPVYIADDAGKELMQNSELVRSQIIELLGPDSYTDDLPNRKYIASVVFNSAEKLSDLNKIIHPAVAAHFEKWKKAQTGPYIIYEAAILFESGRYTDCDAVILVTAPYDKRLERLQKRDKSTVAEIEARMNHQWSDEKKRAKADFEVINSEISNTKEQVQNVHEILLNPSKN